MSSRIAIVTTRELDVPDADEQLLMPLLPGADLVAWEDDIDWGDYAAVVLRSTWNYHRHLDEFLDWTRRVEQVTQLVNPATVIAWNTNKRYLDDLAAAGIPTVPTAFVALGDAAPADSLQGHVVVKPTVGAGSNGARLFRDQPAEAAAHLTSLHAEGKEAMIQPYMAEVDTAGERALMFIGGEFSHAATKAALLSREMSWTTGIYADEKVVPAVPSASERALAERIVAALPTLVSGGDHIVYARIDLLPTPDGPVVLELELTEPSLFLALGDGAAERAAAAFRALARG